MESDSGEEESQYFRGIRESRQSDHRHNVTRGGQEVAWLNAKRGRVLGPNTSMEVTEGDSVELSVFAKYEIPRKRVNRASLFPRGAARKLATDLGDIVASGPANPFTLFQIVDLIAEDLQQKPAPEAYLGYALYDSDSVLYEKGKRILSKKAANNHEELREKLYISKTGYIETFLVNETNEDVWFDDFSVMSISSILVQETHYDPWGLELKELGFQAGGIKVNKYLYQGKEFLDDLNLNIYDFHARGYDPTIGRTWQQDPHGENYFSLSPYSWAANNPLLFIDPDGRDINFYMWAQNGDDWERKKVSFNPLDKNIQKALEAFAKTETGNAFLSQFAKAGDKVGSVEFSKDGDFSKHEMGFDQFETRGAAYGTQGFSNDREKIGFYMKINTGRSNEDKSPESYAITVGHEAFIHMDQYKDRLIEAFDNKDVKRFREISAERRRIANDRNGGVEHDAYIHNKPEQSRMRAYVNQLKKVLNPSEVNKQIQKHDRTIK